MRIRMKETRAGSEDGLRVRTFEGGVTYNVEASLAAVFLREGWAEKVEERPKLKSGTRRRPYQALRRSSGQAKMLRRAPEDK